ncbi:WD40-repeat-containing domain protein [Thamnidium elegans]|nr:WD40-repeat-containing domain protein [Thamnidium elegans]
MLTTLPPYQVRQIVDRIRPYLQRDIVSQLPNELAIYTLGFLDVASLLQASQVSKSWQIICENPSLWRNLFEHQGWAYDRDEMDTYLLNTPMDEDYHASCSSSNNNTENSNSSNSSNCGARNNKSDTAVEEGSQPAEKNSIPIKRSSSPLINRKKLSKLYSMRNLKKHNDESEYHYDHNSDTRFINWKRLYRNRYAIEQRWIQGDFKARTFPPANCLESDLHWEGIYCLQFDKEKYVTGSRDRTIKIWDLSGKCKQTLKGHSGSVLCLQYDATSIVSGSSDSNIMITNIDSGFVIRILRGHRDGVLSLRLMNDDQIISCSKDRSLRLWNRETGECVRVFLGHHAAVNAVQWKDKRVVSASGDRTIRIWDLDTGKCLKQLVSHTGGVACVEFDGTHIVSGSSDKTIKIWNAETGDCLFTLAGHLHLVRTVQIDNVANRIVSGCYNGNLKIWDLKDGTLIRDLGQATEGSRVLNLKFDFTKIVCCSNLVELAIYDFADNIDIKFLI